MEPVRSRPPYAQPPHGDHRPPPSHYPYQPQHHHPAPHSQPPPPPVQQQHPQQQQPQHPPAPHPSQQQQQQQQPPPQPHQQHYTSHPPPPPPPPPAQAGPSLPPIQQPYPPPGAPQEQPNHLAPLRHPHDAREAPEYHQYNQHNHSGHATPAPVNRSYSVDSSHPQRTPTTPAQPAAYPPTSAPDAAHPPMEHHSYPPTNGVTHGHPQPSQGPPPPQGPPPQHEPQHHYAMTPVMDNHNHNGYPPPPPMYAQPPGYGPAASINFNVQRKKQMRATQACEQCRQRKQKCDEGSPCSFCKESNLPCQYRDTPPAKTDKNMDKVIALLEQVSQGNQDLRQDLATRLSAFDDRLRRMEQQRIKSSPVPPPSEPSEPEEPAPKRKQELDDHRTAPHKLILLWPSVRPLLQEANVDVNDGYVMEAEDRGVLRLYGRGEGIEEQDGTQPGGPASPARSEDSFSDAPSPPEGIWGCGLPAYAYPTSESRSHPYTAGGLKPDGTLDLDQSTINSLWESYVKHMHVMHPFLDKARTRKLINKFISRYCPNRQRMHSHNTFAVGDGESDRPIKRQRSNGPTGSQGMPGEVVTKRFVDTERSPSNAVIYLVLALGKICAHKESLPGPVQDRVLNANQVLAHQLSGNPGLHGSSPMSTNVKPSPGSPKLTPNHLHTPPAGYPNENPRMEYRSRRSSFDGSASSTQTAKNMDVIPGIAYYAKAAEILGDQGDGNDLIHAQMFLLAGLYKGQLARVKESMSWITMAGRVIQTLLDRYKLYNDNYWTAYGDVRRQHEKGQKLITDMRQNLIVLASWTCLQLESDILAELRLPSSGIQNIENLLLMPHNLAEEETYEGLAPHEDRKGESYNNVILFYTAQMFLRKRLNQVHRQLYGPDCLNQPLAEVQAMLHGHEAILDGWRAMLPPDLKWADDDPPPAGILSARLRAKYWGARYVINRPFLDYALHIMPHVKDGQSVEEVALDVHRNPRDKAEIHLFKAIELMGEGEVWAACRRCIEAAMQSTVALDGVPDRLVVTNIHGTAHAQFGNMLVLSATWRTHYLRKLIDQDRFQVLLGRTIGFLRKLSAISPTCQLDCSILEKIQRVLFGIPADEKPMYHGEKEFNNSFSSATT